MLKAALWMMAGLLAFRAPAENRPNIILISVDTLRQDHVSAYGYGRNTTPNIDRLLKSGVWFTNATSNIPLTNPSFASLMTSRYPHEVGATRNGVPMIGETETLAQLLHAQGYATAAFLSNWPLKARISNLQKGFDVYDDNFYQKRWVFFNNERDAKEVTKLAGNWLEKNPKQSFFLWVHYSDPHAPYNLHRGFSFTQKGETPTDTQAQIDAYDSEVGYTDHYLGLLLAQINSLGLKKNSLIFFIADHGEQLGERGYTGHGRYLFEPSIRVPFGLSGPISAGQRIDAQVELLDVAPTILAYAGIPAGKNMRGRNLLPFIAGRKNWPANYIVYLKPSPARSAPRARKSWWT